MLFALALIFACEDLERPPTFTCCAARAFAFTAWALSGVG
ncbi:hypothetical protein AcetOrient_orf04444 [Acetobacter orientalis]|uniref:Uncharacterized protein n=1 Tax=Acetobacter orientalis TaxID=146474 RepID=A0A2Z5ZL45_9PROT|nr:hypothetical protein AcetOrient_orf04444 [Acetobacter orientalis]